MRCRARLKKLGSTLTPRVFPDWVVVIEGLEPGGEPDCVITTRFDPGTMKATTNEVWREDIPA